MVTADQVVVELEARIQQYMANVSQAEAKFESAAGKIAVSATKVGKTTEDSFGRSLSSIGKYSTGAQTSLNALSTGLAKFTGQLGSTPKALDSFFVPFNINTVKASLQQNAMATQVLSANNRVVSSFAELQTKTSTSFLAMNAAAQSFSTTIRNMPDMSKGMRNPLEPIDDFLEKFDRGTHNLQFNLANLSAQFNDIGVTAAAGMNPMIIALQQGTQLSQAFAGQNLAQVASGIGRAFMAVVSPTALVTIGLVAASAALVQWAMASVGAKEGGKKAEDQIKALDDALSKLSKNLEVLNQSDPDQTFGNMTPEVKELTEALVQLNRVAELKALKDSLGSLVKESLDPGLFKDFGIRLAAATSSAAATAITTPDGMQKFAYDDMNKGKGLSFEDFKLKEEMLKTLAAAGDVENVMNVINDLMKEMADGGPISGISEGMRDILAKMGVMAIDTAKVEAQFNGSADAAKAAAVETEKWAKIYASMADVGKEMADRSEKINASRAEELKSAEQNLKIAEAEFKFGESSTEALTAKRDVEIELLEIKLRGKGLYEEEVQAIVSMVERTEALSAATSLWSGLVNSASDAKEKFLDKSREIYEYTQSELLTAQQSLALAEASASFGSDSAEYAAVKAQIDLDNLETALRAKGVSEDNAAAIMEIVAQTDNVIAATAVWENAMIGVRSVIAQIVSDISRLGGGMVANAAKSVEAEALRQGKTRAEAVREARKFQTDMEFKAREMGANPYEKLVIWGERQIAARADQLDEELGFERDAASERERLAKKAERGSSGGKSGKGGGGRKGSKSLEDPRTNIYEQIRAYEEEAKMLDALEVGYNKFGSSIAIARKEEEILQALQKKSIEITPTVAAEVKQMAAAYVASSEAAKEAAERHSEFASKLEEFRSTTENAFSGLVTGALSFRDALGSILDKLAEMFASQAFGYLMGDSGQAGGGMGGNSILNWGLSALFGSSPGPSKPSLSAPSSIGSRSAPQMPSALAASSSGGRMTPRVEVVATVDGGGNITQLVRDVSGEVAVKVVESGLKKYDSTMPARVKQISIDPRKR